MPNYNSTLQSNNTDLQEILNTINELPEVKRDPVLQDKTVTPTTSQQTVIADDSYDGLSQVTVNAMPITTQATPSITVSSSGLITASSTQTAGYVSAGTESSTKQLTTQAAKTITPNTSSQTAVAKNVYTTGAITVAGDANLKAENIAEGVSIFGITGTHSGGSSGGVSIETCTVTLHDDPYLAIKSTWYYTDVNMRLQQCTGSGEITVPKNTLMAFIYCPDMSYRFYGNNITSILSASIDAENSCEVVQICGDCEIEITPDDAGDGGEGSFDPDE